MFNNLIWRRSFFLVQVGSVDKAAQRNLKKDILEEKKAIKEAKKQQKQQEKEQKAEKKAEREKKKAEKVQRKADKASKTAGRRRGKAKAKAQPKAKTTKARASKAETSKAKNGETSKGKREKKDESHEQRAIDTPADQQNTRRKRSKRTDQDAEQEQQQQQSRDTSAVPQAVVVSSGRKKVGRESRPITEIPTFTYSTLVMYWSRNAVGIKLKNNDKPQARDIWLFSPTNLSHSFMMYDFWMPLKFPLFLSPIICKKVFYASSRSIHWNFDNAKEVALISIVFNLRDFTHHLFS